jgi:hypothetical protein
MRLSTKTVLRSFFWLILSVIFGQLQLWVIWGNNEIGNTPDIMTFEKIILQGYPLFFCTGITTSLGLDYYFETKIARRDEQIIYSLFPFVVLLLGVFIGANMLGKDIKNINIHKLNFFHLWLVSLTGIYIITVK